ncbi:MAG TPA: carboxymuconolactone decarboxylase family protein [Kofleriaceae bacterium]|jgi:alkylhydroperoxidase family enzyme|nr:carboxymuconolactone decarboxylase family protein [Kofleriaceae bacterium]
MTRIPPRQPPYEPTTAEDLAKLMPPGVPPLRLFTTLAHNPRVLRRVRKGGLLDPGAIALREREIVILGTCALCGAEYEWGVHVQFFAAAAGLTPAQIAATVSGDPAAFSRPERLLLALCEALHRAAAVPDALWAQLAEAYRPEQLVELVVLAGQYHMISYVTNALAIELEPGAPRFPAG